MREIADIQNQEIKQIVRKIFKRAHRGYRDKAKEIMGFQQKRSQL